MTIKWDSYRFLLLITIIGTIPFTFISYTDYFWSAEPSQIEGINAIVYILLWFVISFYMGIMNQTRYRKFTFAYFIILTLSSLLVKVPSLGIFIPIVLSLGGAYTGLGYYIDLGTNLFVWGPLATLMLINLGYSIGTYLKRRMSFTDRGM